MTFRSLNCLAFCKNWNDSQYVATMAAQRQAVSRYIKCCPL